MRMFDSKREVEAYLKNFPSAYLPGTNIHKLIQEWLTLTEAIRSHLDRPPKQDDHGNWRAESVSQ